jgi:hypothetical protein
MGKSAQLREEGQREGERADRGDAEDRKEKSGEAQADKTLPRGVYCGYGRVWECWGCVG